MSKQYTISRQIPEEELSGENRKVTSNHRKPQEKQIRLPVEPLRALGWIDAPLVYDYHVEGEELIIHVRRSDAGPEE